ARGSRKALPAAARSHLGCQLRRGHLVRVMRTKLLVLGRSAATQVGFAAIEGANQDVVDFFSRHVTGDWGEVSQEDRVENEVSLLNGYRLLSAYRTRL